jgi:transcriptional regulator with GAF, ATPase, and Fis domain
MEKRTRNTGISVVGDMPWGTHFCHFYNTKADLLETLVPYFKAGLEDNELCVWVYSPDLTEREITDAMTRALPGFDKDRAEGRIEIHSFREWYFNDGTLSLKRVLNRWREKLSQAAAGGFDGIRVSGRPIWLETKRWNEFSDYEKELDESITNLRMICLCSYPMQTSGAAEVLDIARTHQFAVARQNGIWEVVETSVLKQAKSEMKRLNDQLEQRVAERTEELTEANLQLRRALEEIDKLRQRLESENAYLREEVKEAQGGGQILGNSDGIRRVLGQIELVAPTDATVLILGETGVGKELVARAIHERSPRRDGQFVKVNCTAIPRELFESEFFGHLRGAFTGATRDRMGRFRLADGGTLFLDEVGDLPPEMQPKLLRVLQDGEYERVGEDQALRANVRIVTASNRDLRRAVREGRFREDLYYRLSVFPIEVPPLRERKEEIPILAKYFFDSACKRFARAGLVLTEAQLQQLLSYHWPGNVRELQNVIDRAVIGARDRAFHVDPSDSGVPRNAAEVMAETITNPGLEVISDEEMKRRERDNIIIALKRSDGKIYGAGGAAELLGIAATTLSSRIKKLKIRGFAMNSQD